MTSSNLEIPLTASDSKCKNVYQSQLFQFTLNFIGVVQATKLQALNQFCYKTTVGRVLTRFRVVDEPVYYVSGNGNLYIKNTLRSGQREFKFVLELTNCQSIMIIQIGRTLYDLNYQSCRWTRFSNIDIGMFRTESLARPKFADREFAALANYKDQVICLSGGIRDDSNTEGILISSVQVYRINMNKWRNLPDLVHARANHSSCTLGGELFVFGG